MPRRITSKVKSLLSRRRQKKSDSRYRSLIGTPGANRKLLAVHRKNPSKYPGVPPKGSPKGVTDAYIVRYREHQAKKRLEKLALQRAKTARKSSKPLPTKEIPKSSDYNPRFEAEKAKFLKAKGRDYLLPKESDAIHKKIGGIDPVRENLDVAGRQRKRRSLLKKKYPGKTVKQAEAIEAKLNEAKRARRSKQSDTQKALDDLFYKKIKTANFAKEAGKGRKLVRISAIEANRGAGKNIRVRHDDGKTYYYKSVADSRLKKPSKPKPRKPKVDKARLERLRKKFGADKVYVEDGVIKLRR